MRLLIKLVIALIQNRQYDLNLHAFSTVVVETDPGVPLLTSFNRDYDMHK